MASEAQVIHEGSPFAERAPTWWDRFEGTLERLGERLNPILVKEARQALKSRQFVMTFLLVLICGWGWSLLYLYLAMINLGEGIYYAPIGDVMLAGFYWVLSFPLLIVVPFAAFRSLSSEREDGTFELVSITALRPRQIVGGKLGSALLQMMLYLSALAPGMAFTYMLRGVDLLQIVLIFALLTFTSILLSIIGLVLATVTNSRAWQMVLGMIFILGLAILFCMSGTFVTWEVIMIGGALPYAEMEFWAGLQTIVSIFAAYGLLFFLTAASRVTFESDNRSTRLRVAMLVIHAVVIGWVMWWWIHGRDEEYLYFAILWAFPQWLMWGGMMVGESDLLSPRVRRSLPSTYLGRLFFTWFNPGPCTGYLFSVVAVFSVVVTILVAGAVASRFPNGGRLEQEQILALLFMFGYVTFYVGATRLLMIAANRFVYSNVFLSLLVLILLMVSGIAMPLLFDFGYDWWFRLRDNSYWFIQAPNWAWTLMAIGDNSLTQMGNTDIPYELVFVLVAAGGVLVLNLLLSSKEIDPHKETTPDRVMQDERELHPQKYNIQTGPSSPWDEPAKAKDEPG